MVNDSAATESLLKHIKPLWIFPALILTACGVEPRLPGPVVREEVGNFGDLPQFDRVPQQVLDFQQVSNFDRSAYNGPLGIDSAIDTSDVIEELRAAGSTSLLVTIATRHPPCQRFRRKRPEGWTHLV